MSSALRTAAARQVDQLSLQHNMAGRVVLAHTVRVWAPGASAALRLGQESKPRQRVRQRRLCGHGLGVLAVPPTLVFDDLGSTAHSRQRTLARGSLDWLLVPPGLLAATADSSMAATPLLGGKTSDLVRTMTNAACWLHHHGEVFVVPGLKKKKRETLALPPSPPMKRANAAFPMLKKSDASPPSPFVASI